MKKRFKIALYVFNIHVHVHVPENEQERELVEMLNAGNKKT